MFEATNVLLFIAAVFYLIVVILLCVVIVLLVKTRSIRELLQKRYRTFVDAQQTNYEVCE